ncbi:hypothetical protein ACF0H5_004477 [Mactra antiquata]
METQDLVQIQQPQGAGFMNFEDSINYFVGKGKVSKAAIYDSGGKPLAGTSDMQISDQDVRAIANCVSIPINVYHRIRFGLFIGNVRYICFKVDSQTVIGITKDEIFVAHQCDTVMIIAFVQLAQQKTDVSCLGEVWNFAEELKSHMEVSTFVQ